jgi:hypothetical protein
VRGCNELRDLVALYAAGDLDEKDRAQVERHLALCPECRRAAAEMSTLVSATSVQPVAPPEGLGERIMREVGRHAVTTRRASVSWSAALGCAASVALVFGAGIWVGLQLPGSSVRGRLSPIAQAPPPGAAPDAISPAAEPPPVVATPRKPSTPTPAVAGASASQRRNVARPDSRNRSRHGSGDAAGSTDATDRDRWSAPPPADPQVVVALPPAGLDDVRLIPAAEGNPGW